jgi:hypothetical protein
MISQCIQLKMLVMVFKSYIFQVKEYDHDTFVQHVTAVAQKQDVRTVWVSFDCNFRIYSSIPEVFV